MKNAVIIKSFPNGLSIFLDSELPFSQLLEEIALKFSESANFFKDASMVVSFEGRLLSDLEERQIVDTISANSRLNIVCIMGKDEETDKNFVKALQQLSFHQDVLENAGQFYKGTLKDGQILETENSIIVLGDVYPGACIISSKDIVVLGTLTGDVYAGAGGNSNHFVVALNMLPGVLQIGDYVYNSQPQKTPRWGFKKPQTVPKIAYTHNGEVQIESITKELLDNFTL